MKSLDKYIIGMSILAGPQAYYYATRELPSAETADDVQHEIQKKLEKIGKKFTNTLKQEKSQDVPIETEFSDLVETSLTTVRDEEKGMFGRMCAVTTSHELYNGALQYPRFRVEHSAAVYRVLQCGAQLSARFDQQVVDPKIISGIFTGIRDNQNPMQIEENLVRYVTDPFLSPDDNEAE